MTSNGLQVGFSEVDITPPVGLPMCGSLKPRTNVGVDDPLMAKAMVAEAGGNMVAVVGVDLLGLPRSIVDPAIEQASRESGVPAEGIIVSCSHTHSGPYTAEGIYSFGVTDSDYLASLPGRIAKSVIEARRALQPATMHIGRSVVYHCLHNRRVLAKDGKAVNTWFFDVLNDLERMPQFVGSAGPVDPELWVLRFDDRDGHAFGAFVNFSVHVNTHFGVRYSADYPGVIARTLRQEYGDRLISVFTPGACANINSTVPAFLLQREPDSWLEAANYFAGQALAAARRAVPVSEPVPVRGLRRDVLVDRRDVTDQPEEAFDRLGWPDRRQVFGEDMVRHLGAMPEKLSVPVNAARLGPFAIATNAGELFVEHGLDIKRRSPFKHTVVAELTNDVILYQPTRQAFAQQGYETMVGANRVSIDGIESLVNTAVELLQQLHQSEGG